jgi:ribosomal protein S18 acetylase RimI-like enzyme
MSDASKAIIYGEEPELRVEEFLDLARSVWPRDYWVDGAQRALRSTINLTARVDGELVGSVRILTDGYFFGTIPEVVVHPAYQGRGIGRRLMELAWERSPTGLFFGAQEGNEGFFEKLGYERSMASFAKRKPRPTSAS